MYLDSCADKARLPTTHPYHCPSNALRQELKPPAVGEVAIDTSRARQGFAPLSKAERRRALRRVVWALEEIHFRSGLEDFANTRISKPLPAVRLRRPAHIHS